MKRLRILAAMVIVAGLIVSCAGAPETPEQPPQEVKTVSGRPEAEAARQAANAARTKADEVKAGVAARDEYTAAQETYKKAELEFAAERYTEAAAAYKLSEDGFNKAAKLTADRRAAAQAAMQSADASLKTTDERLKAIETEIGGGTP